MFTFLVVALLFKVVLINYTYIVYININKYKKKISKGTFGVLLHPNLVGSSNVRNEELNLPHK